MIFLCLLMLDFQLVAMDKVTPSADKKSLPPCVLTAHVGDIAVLAVNAQGTMLASGSTKVRNIFFLLLHLS